MAKRSFRWRSSTLGTALGLSLVLPLAFGAAPAYAVGQPEITKAHPGDFARGGQGVYTITVINVGDDETGKTVLTDELPEGLSVFSGGVTTGTSEGVTVECFISGTRTIGCESSSLPEGGGYTVRITVNVAADAPCTVTNTATVEAQQAGTSDSASDPTTITGGGCGDGNGNGNGSVLPVDLSGVVTLFDNITNNSTVQSPGTTNTTHQGLSVDAS
ncbi:hypothetical protein [Streptomyces sp. NPDC012888]|uniref:hypothetical protein n=1 Tax=Streptomyces sp. NPDC012888 TaxID=3364855 RepID=UPI0036A16B9F